MIIRLFVVLYLQGDYKKMKNAEIDLSHILLTTDRLILRPFAFSDLDDFYEYAKVDGVGECAGWVHHKSKEESNEILNMFIKEKKTFAIVYKENNKVIGSLGIEETSEIYGKYIEENAKIRTLGYVLSKDYWGKGLMTEAVKTVITYLFTNNIVDYLSIDHYCFNNRSQRVIEKCGFRFVFDGMAKTRYNTIEKAKYYLLKKEK